MTPDELDEAVRQHEEQRRADLADTDEAINTALNVINSPDATPDQRREALSLWRTYTQCRDDLNRTAIQ